MNICDTSKFYICKYYKFFISSILVYPIERKLLPFSSDSPMKPILHSGAPNKSISSVSSKLLVYTQTIFIVSINTNSSSMY